MKIKWKHVNIFLWILLSTGLLVLNQFQQYKTLVLYGIIPACFFLVIIKEGVLKLDNSAFKYLLLFVLWCSLSYFYTVNTEMALNYLSVLLGALVLWYTTNRIVWNAGNVILLVKIFVVSLLFHAIQGIIIPVEIQERIGYGRSQGLFSNPNALGFTMWYGVTGTVLLLLHSGKNRIHQLLAIGVIGIFMYVLLESGSRKNAVAFFIFVSVLIYYLVRSKYRGWVLGLGLILIIIYYFFDVQQLEQTALFVRSSEISLQEGGEIRMALVIEGWQMFLSNPIFGVGLGSFTTFSSLGLMAHNDFIEILASTGIVGLLLYLPIYWIFYKNNKVLIRNPDTYSWGVWSQAFLIGFLVLGMGRPTFLDPVAILVLAFFHSLSWRKAKLVKCQWNRKKQSGNADLPYYQHA